MPSTYQPIVSTILTGVSSSVYFSSIPATFTDLILRCAIRNNLSGFCNLSVYVNSSSSGYSHIRLRGNGSSVAVQGTTGPGYIYGGVTNDATSASDIFSSHEIYIPNYAGNLPKQLSSISAEEDNASTAYIDSSSILWNNTAAITAIELVPSSGQFIAGSTFRLYGIKNS